MKERAPLLLPLSLLLTAAATTGCSQPVNTMASEGTKVEIAKPPPPPHSRVIETPAIDIWSGGTTATYPCERTNFELFNDNEEIAPLGILFQECSGCHQAGGQIALRGFDFILDVATLINPDTVSIGLSPGRRLVVPGDPDNSYLFQRMRDGAMPPAGVQPGINPEPINVPATTSEASIVYEWIAHCLNATASAPETGGGTGGGTGGASGGGTGGADGEGGAGGDPGTGGAAAGGRGGRAGRNMGGGATAGAGGGA